ncbi:SDR family oxidoreductase [Clostridium sp.]|uniref:SDR family oxidoreductase n=1 Tax=Clostridium sp. TaxID=1506 RepID=UPI003D6D46DE
MNTILITGSQGFFASRFIKYYEKDYNVIGINHSNLDITDEKETIKTIIKYNPDYVIHCAALSDTGFCQTNPEKSYNTNVKGSINVAKGCLEAKAKLVFLSSDQVYNGNTEVGPYNEECVALPNTVYGNHKLLAEKGILEIMDDIVILRLTWLFCLPERCIKVNSNIVWNVVKATLKNESIKLPSKEYRGITYVYDLIENFDKIIHLNKGIYNAGSENNLSTYEIGEIVLKKMGIAHRIKDILVKDIEKYKIQCRDLRISNDKLKDYDIHFNFTEQAISKCLSDFY